MKNLHVAICLIFVLLSVSSCFKKEDFDLDMLAKKQEISYDLAMPLVDTRLSIDHLVEAGNGLFVTDEETRLISLIYKTEKPQTLSLSDMLEISDVNIPSISTGSIPYFKKDTILIFSYADELFLDLGDLPKGSKVDRINFSKGGFSLEYVNTFGILLPFDLSFDNLYDANGNKIVIKFNIEANGRSTYELDLANTYLVFDEDLELKYSAVIRADLSKAENEFPNIQSGALDIQIALRNLDFSRLEGYFGKFSFESKDVLDVDGLDDMQFKKMQFHEAYLEIISEIKGASLPIRIVKGEVSAQTVLGGGQSVPLFPANYDISTPLPNDVPLEKVSMIKTDITDLLADLPKSFIYAFEAVTNPLGEGKNVIEREAEVNFSFVCVCPLWLTMDDYTLGDTMDFAIAEDVSIIERFELSSLATNAFPIDLIYSLSFLNEANEELFSLSKLDSLVAGKIGPAPGFNVVEPEKQMVKLELNSEQILKLGQVKKMSFNVLMSTPNKQEVKVYANDDKEGFVRFQIGARVKLRLGELVVTE